MEVKSAPAPIGISTYKRVNHLRNAIASLQANPLAAHSKLFVFSDAPRPGDEEGVSRVRSFASTIDGFDGVEVVERAENNRVRNNRGGIEYLLEKFGRCIFIEEDIVVAPGFLDFMNQGLEIFEDKKNVFAVCGYTPPIEIGTSYGLNSYLCSRFSAWGFAIWADRYSRINTGSISLESLTLHQRHRFRLAGTDLLDMTRRMETGQLEALDVRINYTMAKHGHLVVCPTRSLTVNRGFDGTGIHCGNTDYFETGLDDRTEVDWDFPNAKSNRNIDKRLFFFRGRHALGIKNQMRYLMGMRLEFLK